MRRFAHKSYRTITAKNTAEWCKLVNDSINYSKLENWTLFKTIEFYFWKAIRGFSIHDMPHNNWWWSKEVKKDRIKKINNLISNYNECKANIEKIKFYFNKTTSLKMIERQITELKNKIYGI